MRKIISIVLSFGMLFQQSGLLYAAGEINLANYLSQARNAIVQPDRFQPARLRYISYDMANNDFKLLLDKGNAKLNDATPELFNYFLIGLALPNDTFWVNLRPDAPENIIDPILEKTDIGKIFLEADLQLKKDTAGLTSPQNPEGKSYWDKLYKKAGELFGTENITIPTITRPWIVPNEVIVRETEDSAYIYKATLKVMLESDYLIGRGGSRTAPTPDQYAFSDPRLKELNEYSSQLIRETLIPKLTKEINSSKRYAQLRQVYYSLVLARWFKQKYSSPGSISAPERQSAGASANSYISLIDSGNLANLASKESYDKQTYFQAYQKSFKDGEYNLKETVATPFGQSIRSYVSGGLGLGPQIDEKISKLVNTVGKPVTRALEDGLAPVDQTAALSASPLTDKELYEYMDEIRVYLKGANKGISHLFANIDKRQKQDITDVLRIIMGPIDKKIVSITKGELSGDGLLSYVQSLRDGLNEIATKNLPLRLNNMANGGKKEMATKVSENIVAALVKVEELYKKLQNSAGSPLTLKEAKKRAGDILFKIVRVEDGVASFLREENSNVRKAFEKSNILDKIGEYYNPNTGEVDDFRVLSEALESIRWSIDSFLRDKRVEGIKEKTAYIMMNKAGKNLGGLIKDIDDEILRRLLLPPEFITARDEISRELQNVINSLEDSINPIKVKAEYRSRYFSFVTEVMAEIWYIHEGFEENKDSFTGYNALLDIIDKKVVPVIDNLSSKVKVKLVDVRTGLDFARRQLDKLEDAGYLNIETSLENIEKRVSEFNKRFALMRNKLSELSGHKKISVGSPVLGESLYDGQDRIIPGLRFLSYADIKGNMKKSIMDGLKKTVFTSNNGGSLYYYMIDFSSLSGMYFAVELDGSGEIVELKGVLKIVDGKEEIGGKGNNKDIIDALEKKAKKIVSSAVVPGRVPQKTGQLGGIDLTDRALHIKLERVGSFAATPLLLPQVKNVQDLDLDREFEQIEALASSGISPNSRRILELFTVCHYRGEFGQRLTQIISCLKASSAIQEAEAIDSDEDFRLALMMPEVLS